VVVIAEGRIVYDGSLSGIIDRFSGHKIITLLLADEQPTNNWTQYGELLNVQSPKVRLKVARATVSDVLASILANHTVEDVSVEDPPLEEVIAELFTQATTPTEQANIDPKQSAEVMTAKS
jgi:ABC-2 type transport system ATP-binding protein